VTSAVNAAEITSDSPASAPEPTETPPPPAATGCCFPTNSTRPPT